MKKRNENKIKKIFKAGLIISIALAFLGSGVTVIGTFDTGSVQSTYHYAGSTISIENTLETKKMHYQISDFSMEHVPINDLEYSHIILGEEPNLIDKGKPDLPYICRSVIVPDTAKMEVKISSYTYEDYTNILITPSKGHFTRDIDPDGVPYSFDPIYTENVWYPKTLVELSEPYILRDFRGQVVKLYPFQYNPGMKTLRVYTDITLEMYPTGTDTRSILTRATLPETLVDAFIPVYQNHFLDFPLTRYTPVGEQGNMLVITYDSFWDAMVPFVEWKNMKGIPTEMVLKSDVGTTASAIQTYISDYYFANGLTFVLLVGDAPQIPTLYANGAASDPSYSYVIGGDHYPDLFVGRFSASSTSHVQTQVERSIEYEKFPHTGGDWYHKGLGIASDQGAGYGDDGEADWQHMRNIRTDLINYYYTQVDELYDGSHGGEDAPGYPTPSMVATSINDGRGIINYCGHGTYVSWSSSEFSTNHINSLVNDNELPFIFSVACSNGDFDSATCFAEVWLRATHSGEPTGAIVTFMSARSQEWAPPMAAQDEFVDILVESYPGHKKTSFAGLAFSGCMLMNDEYGWYGYRETDAWTVFGDPSLQVRTNTPATMTVNHDPNIAQGALTFEVDVLGIEDALCALSRNSILLGFGYTDATGHALITLDEPLTGTDDVDLVVTAYNTIPYITSLLVGGNTPPEIPAKPTGRIWGVEDTLYTYTTSTTDPNGDQVFYQWDWGDGHISDWLGPYDSGVPATAQHAWSNPGRYYIKVKAKDTEGAESDWSEAQLVAMRRWGLLPITADPWIPD